MAWAVVGLGLSLIGAGLLVSRLEWEPLWSWLLCVNVMTFLFYGLDKSLARREGRRIPERVLLALTALGGTPLALLAMRVFRHKTIKRSFRVCLGVIVIVQLLAVGWAIYSFVQSGKLEQQESLPQGVFRPDHRMLRSHQEVCLPAPVALQCDGPREGCPSGNRIDSA